MNTIKAQKEKVLDIEPKTSDVDVIVSWPKSMDYPLWRKQMQQLAPYFNKIFIVFTETNKGIDYSDFVKSAINDNKFVFLDSPEVKPGEDWRNVAVNEALRLSKASVVWFTEQDCLIVDPAFWTILRVALLKFDVIGYKDGNRLHPSNLWVKREFINKTRKDFSVVPDRSDHFSKFYFDLRHANARIHNFKSNQDGSFEYFYHMNGLSHNLSLIQDGEMPNYMVADFNGYLYMSLDVEPLDDRYRQMVAEYFARVKKRQDESI